MKLLVTREVLRGEMELLAKVVFATVFHCGKHGQILVGPEKRIDSSCHSGLFLLYISRLLSQSRVRNANKTLHQ